MPMRMPRRSRSTHSRLLALTLTLLALMPGLARPADAANAPAPDANAALQYWQAFALLPALNQDQEKRLAEWNTAPLNQADLALIASSAESRRLLLRGASRPTCDWGLDYSEGPGLLLPHLAKARDLARLTALHARSEIEQGHITTAADDAKAILTLGRHVGNSPIAISILVRYMIEGTAIDLVASHLTALQAVSPGIMTAYDALPAGATFQDAYLNAEEHTIRWLATSLRSAEAKQPGAWRTVWKNAIDRPDGLDVINRVDSLEQALKLTEDLLPVCDELATLAALPKPEFDARYPEFKKKTKTDHPLAGYFLTTPDTVLATQHRHQARVALLKAAIAIEREGPAKIKDFPDPFGSGPFEYRSLNPGFELKSKLRYRDQPVLLTVIPSQQP